MQVVEWREGAGQLGWGIRLGLPGSLSGSQGHMNPLSLYGQVIW